MSTLTETHPSTQAQPDADAEVWGVLAEFENPGQLMLAAEKVRDAGYSNWDCYSPFPVHGLDRAMGLKMTNLPVLIFFCGALGCTLGVVLQWFTNASPESWRVFTPVPVTGYPFMISGKPTWSLPANVPVIFELTVLLSAFGAVFGMLGLNKLPMLYNPLFKRKRFLRVTTDRYFIAIEAKDAKFDIQGTSSFLKSTGATAVEAVED